MKIELKDEQIVRMANAIKTLREAATHKPFRPLNIRYKGPNGYEYNLSCVPSPIVEDYCDKVEAASAAALEAYRKHLREIADGEGDAAS